MSSVQPLTDTFSHRSPAVTGNPWMRHHHVAYLRMIDREPSAFERATAAALMEAYERMPKRGPVKTFTALSAATGAGKSTSACALMVYLARTQWHTSAYVVPTIAVAEEIHRHLLKLTEGTAYTVACWTSVHKANASSRVLDQYAEQNVVPARRYTEQQFKAAQLVVTTHDRWKHELTTGTDLGVLKCNGGDRDLVVVDEEPELEYTVVRQPEDVSALASLLAPPDVAPEGAAHGFTAVHPAADTLAVVHERMRAIKDNATGQFLRTAEVVTEADAETLASVDRRELTGRIALLSIADRQAALELHLGTLQFLKLCAQGRVFYTRGNDGGFYAYGSPAAPQPRHLILDGTADLNGMYAIGKHVSVVNPFPANYERVRLHAVKLPRELTKEIGGKMNDKGMLRNDETVATYLRWFVPFLLEHTQRGTEGAGLRKEVAAGLRRAPSGRVQRQHRPQQPLRDRASWTHHPLVQLWAGSGAEYVEGMLRLLSPWGLPPKTRCRAVADRSSNR